MAICRFFQQGTCRYGNACKFEHPNPNNNRFGAFGGGGGGNGGFNNNRNKDIPFSLSKDTIQIDLTTDRPQWILSAYGPGRDAPEQLFGGFPREQSFEEIRLLYEEGAAMGNAQAALSQIEGVYREADSQMQNALGNLDGAIQYILDAQNKSPNRLSLLQNNTSGVFAVGQQQQQQPNPFGQPTTTTTTTAFGAPSAGGFGASSATPAAGGGGFGQPSTLGQKPSAFGAPAFGQAAQPAAGGFGQPSALGQKPSAFGTPAFGQSAQPTSAFGQPSKPGGAFGQPAFGQPAAPAFGQSTPMGGAAGGFGQPSALGQKPSPFGSAAAAATGPSPFGANVAPSPFGQSAQSNNSSPFGAAAAASTNTGGSAFGQPSTLGGGGGFGQPSVLGQKPSPFGQAAAAPSPFGQTQTQTQAPSPFGAPAPAVDQSVQMSGATPTLASTTGFGQPQAQAAPPSNNPFGQPTPPANPFGQPAQAAHPFGAAPQQQQQPAGAPAAAAPGPNPYAPNATRQHPPVSSYITKNPDGTVAAFKGKAVSMQTPREGSSATKPFPVMRAFDGSVTRIWNPDGPPAYYKDTEAPPEAYDATTRAAYEVFVNTGKFQGGIMPEVPPLREWCTWDF